MKKYTNNYRMDGLSTVLHIYIIKQGRAFPHIRFYKIRKKGTLQE